MSDPMPYSEQSPEFAEMLKQAEAGLDGGIAALAAANCYMYGSSLFCKDWYECFVLNQSTPEQYKAHCELVTKCMDMARSQKKDRVSQMSSDYM